MKSVTGLAAILLLSAASTAALSADLAGEVPPSAQAGWIATVGAKLTVDPKYPGSDQYTVFGYPTIGLRRASDPETYSALDDGFGIGISVTDWLRVGFAGDFLGERNKDDDKQLKGLKPIDWTVEAGGFVELWPTEFLRGRVELKKAFNGSDGFVADLGMDAIVPLTESMSVAFGPRVDLADSDYMRTYYGVTPKEAARNRAVNRAFRPDGGIESAGLAASVTYKWTEAWTTTVGGGWDRLLGDAADSPITKRIGSEDQFWGGAKISYSFDLPSTFLPGF